MRLKMASLMLKPSKCHFFKWLVGHIISQKGVETDPKKTKDVKKWPIPRRVKDVRSFLGLTEYDRRFIKDCRYIAKPLERSSMAAKCYLHRNGTTESPGENFWK